MPEPRDATTKFSKVDPSEARRIAILDAATRVFLRYGFKKTSMDDVARAAGLSRQALYLHFTTKELLFKDALLRFVGVMQTAMENALADESRSVEDRLLGAFEAVHGHAIEGLAENGDELLEAATTLIGPLAEDLDRSIVTNVVRVLKTSGIAAEWKSAGMTAKDLAENLLATSVGVKHQASNTAAYNEKMRIAIRLVCSKTPKPVVPTHSR